MTLSPTKKFILFYLVYMFLLFTLIELEYFKNLLQINPTYSAVVAKVSAFAFTPFVEASYVGNFIHLPNATLDIKFGCNGLESILLYIAAILAYAATLKQKLYGLVIGFIVINVINIFRILVLGYVLLEHKDMFDIMHHYVTQNIMIVFVFMVFIVYMRLIETDES